jgi:hypothetical protein
MAMADDIAGGLGGGTSTSFNPIYALLGSIGGSTLGSLFSSLFGGGKNPADSAMPYLQQVPGTITPYYQPYIDTGLGAMNQYYNNASTWATPQGAANNYNTIAAGYTASPYSQYQTDQMQQAAAQSAAASGQAGTPAQQAAVANQINGINSRDEQEYINSILRTQQQGQQGLGDLTHQGYDASSSLAQQLARNLGMEGSLAYMGTANKDQSMNGLFSSLGGIGGMLAGLF